MPSQFSANIDIEFVKDESFNDYIVIPSVKYGSTTNALPIENGIVKLPKQAFMQDGNIYLAFLLDNGVEQFNTNLVELYVSESVGGTDVLPPDEKVWTAVVINAVDQYMDIKYIKILDDLIASNKKLNTDTISLQKSVNDVVTVLNEKLDNNDFVPKHKLENGKLYFSNPDGTWDSGYALSGQTSIKLDEVVQENLSLSSVRDTITSSMKVQVTNADGVVLVETSADNIRYLKKDGTDSIDGKTLIDLMAKLISNTSFFDVNPKPMLDELKGYADIT